MNYRHAFHAGNHGDVLKHVVLLGVCGALTAKDSPCFALDTHAGRGLYALAASDAARTGESEGGIGRLVAAGGHDEPLLRRYADAVAACRADHGGDAYPGSPWLLAHALRPQDRIACCELQKEEASALKALFATDPRVAVHARDGYAAIPALLPPRVEGTRPGRGLVLVDPPYERQLAEFDTALAAIEAGLRRWPQGIFALWYPIKESRTLRPVLRRAAALSARSVLVADCLVRPADSPLRMNGSGMLLFNPPWRLDDTLAPALRVLAGVLDEGGGGSGLHWLRRAD